MVRTWKDLPIVSDNVKPELDASMLEGRGVLRLLQNWVHREFCTPGRNLRLDPRDWYLNGPQRGTDERWFASTMPAKNTFQIDHEGLSFVLSPNGKRFRFTDAVQEGQHSIVGLEMWMKYRQWQVYSKFFDNKNALPLHSHMSDVDAKKIGIFGKPESYYFPRHYNQYWSSEPITFMGLRPGTTKEDVRRSLELWGQEDNCIRQLSQGYLMQPGTGWLMPPGILHAPAGLCTFEPQAWSDTFQMYEARTTDGWLPRDVLLFKDIPENQKGNFDHMVELLDWEGNLDPDFVRKNFLMPRLDEDRSDKGVTRQWVVYGTVGGQELFSAVETTVDPGCEYFLEEPGASGLLFMTGRGTIGGHTVEVPTLMRYYDIVSDEFFVTADAADGGTTIRNEGDTPLVFLQYYGPDTWGDEMPKAGS